MTNLTLPPVPQRSVRNASVQDLVSLLESQHRQKVDFVAPLSSIRYNSGEIEVGGLNQVLTEDGFFEVNGLYRPTATAEGQLAGMEGIEIPLKYVRRMRQEHLGLLDANVNEWTRRAPEGKKVLVRTLWGHDERFPHSSGIVRAILSDRYGIRDNLDTVLAVLDGLREAGLSADNFAGADITDDRLYLRIHAPEIYAEAPELLRGYRDPKTGRGSREVGDVIFAGLCITNSETGGGAFTVTPELTTLICMNGQTVNKDALRKVHLGQRLDEGAIVWSNETRQAANNLARAQVVDAVKSFMNPDYVKRIVDGWTEVAKQPLENPQQAIEVIGKQLSYTEQEKVSILKAFVQGGVVNAGGIMHAVTYASKDIQDIERANDVAATGVRAMELAATLKV